MNKKMTLTALVTGFPPELRQPKPLPGENIFQLVIRNHPLEWRNCIERLRKDFGLSPSQASALLNGQLNAVQEAKARAEIERFMNYRLPSHSRTIDCLRKLQEGLKKEPFEMIGSYELLEILWPRERNPSGDRTPETIAEKLGATVIPAPTGESRMLDLSRLLPHVHGEFLWIIPGGTKFMFPITTLQLQRIMKHFSETPRCAMYTDNASSIIYRTAALKELIARAQPLSPESREMARNLQLAGYTLAMDSEPDNLLCELEPEYGGARRKMKPRSKPRRSWWKRMFGG